MKMPTKKSTKKIIEVPNKIDIVNREHWLEECGQRIKPRLEEIVEKKMPKFSISCGFPSRGGLSTKKPIIGQCWPGVVSKGVHQMFIAPTIANEITVSATIAHEMAHAIVGTKAGHKGPFIPAIRGMGLIGKPTATEAGDVFVDFIKPILKMLGPYPHVAMVANNKYKSQPTRLIKCQCTGCGYTVRTTAKWLDLSGTPICPACNQEMEEF
jgi:hypothetical protein